MMDVDAAWNRLDGVSDFRKTLTCADHLLELVTSKGFLLMPMNLSGQDSSLDFRRHFLSLKTTICESRRRDPPWDNVAGCQSDGTFTVVYEWGQGNSQETISRKIHLL